MREVFSDIYKTNFWKSKESVSGHGSTLEQTETIHTVLPQLFAELGISNLLDIPCGDFNWVSHVIGGVAYLGADIVPELIAHNKEHFASMISGIYFAELDAMSDKLPKVDMILCRDMLVHFSNADVNRTLKNFRASGSKYLLATTFPGRNPNQEIETGQWRAIDLEALRYGLGPAMLLINENCTESDGRFSDKSLGLWRLN